MKGRNIVVEQLNQTPIERLEVELVERKGVGHPDYIADSASEVSSIALSQFYRKEFGYILHHNLDKTLVVGGQASPRFGGGDVIQPIYIIVSGRATTTVFKEGEVTRIPVGPLIIGAVKDWIRRNFRFLDPEKHVVIDYRIGQGSADLAGLYELGGEKTPLANDTSFGVGFAPLTDLERVVLEIEKMLNSRDFKSRYPEVGEDVKVMGLRIGKNAKITVAASMISHLVSDLDHYLSVKEEVRNRIADLVARISRFEGVEIYINTADRPEKGLVYLTVTGTSAEHGDDGMTGRGNRANGLITPMRPMSLEATAGKNPVSHVGKIYNALATIIANDIYNKVRRVSEVYVSLLSQIGKPIDMPLVASVKVIPEKTLTLDMRNEITAIVETHLENITKLRDEFIAGKIMLF
ncbi:MAG: methionine adenosyltransferase [Desulfurococcales archaeon]|jgi:S-adenosylmethionine synthetase|nr:methionine adenosyltransferase [Desulfurococcales archaeon]